MPAPTTRQLADMTAIDLSDKAILQDCYTYWSECRGAGAMASREKIDPIDIPRLLPFIYLVDVLEGGADFRYRLIGSNIVTNTPKNYSNCLLSEVAGENTQGSLEAAYRDVVTTAQPQIDRFAYQARSGFRKVYDNLLLPLSDDGTNVTMLLGCAVHHNEIVEG